MDDLLLFQRLVSPDSQLAENAIRALEPKVKRFLWNYLSSIIPRAQDREDAVVEVLAKLWASRQRLQVLSAGAVWRFIAVTARRTALDMIGAHQTEDFELNQEEIGYIDSLADHRLGARVLYTSADELWLGVEKSLADRERNRRLLAAQLYYIEGRNWREILDLLRGGGELTRETLDEWLSDPSTIRHLAFRHVYLSNDELAARLLGCALEHLSQPPYNATPLNQVVLYRYQNGLLREKIAQMLPELSEKDLDGKINECNSRLPFEELGKEVVKALRKHSADSLLSDQGLIKRLVFQYFVSDNLPHKQIYERSFPVALAWNQKLTEGMLNVWLSNGRLLSQLVNYVREDPTNGTDERSGTK